MEVSKFNEKVNKIDGVIHTDEEEVNLTNGVYLGVLKHDNVNKKSLYIYTGSKLTGERITNYNLSIPTETPWKYIIKVFENVDKAYITYEYTGDQIEAEDINNLQGEIVRTQEEVNNYEQSNNEKVNSIDNRVVNVETNKADKDNVFTKDEVLQKMNDLINGAPGLLDTLNEIANALGNDPNFSTTIINLLGNKVDKVDSETLVISTEWEGVKTEINNAKGTFPSIDERLKSVASNSSGNDIYITTNSGSNYSVTIPELTTLSDGYPLTVKFNTASTGAITVNPSGLGARSVVDYFGNLVTNARKDLIANLIYDATNLNFQLLGKGGGGDLVAEDLLFGKKATGDSGPVIGSAPNNSAVIITPGTTNKIIAKGYHNGNGYVAGDPNLLSANIKANKILFGIQGKSSVVDTADALATAAQLLSGVSAYVNGNKIVGNIPNNYGAWQYSGTPMAASGRLHMYPPKGYYDPAGGTGIYYDDPNYIAENIISGKSILGLWGNATATSLGGRRYASGTAAGNATVSLSFTPSVVVVRYYASLWVYQIKTPWCSIGIANYATGTSYFVNTITIGTNTFTCNTTGSTFDYQAWE